MAKTLKSCLQILLELVNSTLGIVGISMIIYSMWMARVWQRNTESSSDDFFSFSVLWFILAFLGIGITLCAITSFGHIAAHTTNVHCLSCYRVAIFLLLLVEIALVADIFLNPNWEEDFPEDPTGSFDNFKDFVKSNFNTCLWIGMFIVFAQECSIVLATVLRNLDKDQARYCESDEDNTAPSLPFLYHPVEPLPYTVADLPGAPTSLYWC